ncbi:hypothetical protein PS6_011847, partial [Mucor atramentarius]
LVVAWFVGGLAGLQTCVRNVPAWMALLSLGIIFLGVVPWIAIFGMLCLLLLLVSMYLIMLLICCQQVVLLVLQSTGLLCYHCFMQLTVLFILLPSSPLIPILDHCGSALPPLD